MNDLLENVKKLLPSIHGWCNFEKAERLVRTIVETNPNLCVEIGVFGGSSLLPQGMALAYNKHGVIYGIDPWATDAALEEMIDESNKKWWGELNLEDIRIHCQKHIDKLGLGNYCRLIKAKSEDVVHQFDDGSVDILHIDGNHSEALSYKDATLYLPKVKPGGYIFFDDIWWSEGEDNQVTTRKAIVYLLETCERIDIVNDCLILKKLN